MTTDSLGRQILAINGDPNLTATEKAKQIQALFMRTVCTPPLTPCGSHSTLKGATPPPPTTLSINELASPPLSLSEYNDDGTVGSQSTPTAIASTSASASVSEVEAISSVLAVKPVFLEDGRMGCEHYSRNCQIKAPCCGAIYPCHWCHDMHAPADHDCHVTMDRTKITHMVCMHCVTLQPASQHCHSGICPSDTSMAIYYCDICHLWVNDPDILNDVSHCHGCGICRRGGDAEFFHCDGCGVCLSIGLKNNHKCFESRLDCDCPICGDLLMTSRATVIFLKCGHPIHKDCFHDCLEKGMYQCPLCMKSAVDMKTSWERIDRLVAVSPMPDEYKSLKAVISCNDCLLESTVPFRFDYSKCTECGSYNTRIMSRQWPEGMEGLPTTQPADSAIVTTPESETATSEQVSLNIDNDVDDDDYMSIDDDNGNE